MYLRNELKQTPLHLELNFDDTLNFIVHHDKWRMYLKNIWIYYYYSTLFLNSGTLQAQGLESKDINAQISNQNNIDDLHETLACLSTGFIYGRNRCDHTQHFKTVESYPQ